LQKYLDFLVRVFGHTLHTTYKQQGSLPGPTARTVFDLGKTSRHKSLSNNTNKQQQREGVMR